MLAVILNMVVAFDGLSMLLPALPSHEVWAGAAAGIWEGQAVAGILAGLHASAQYGLSLVGVAAHAPQAAADPTSDAVASASAGGAGGAGAGHTLLTLAAAAAASAVATALATCDLVRKHVRPAEYRDGAAAERARRGRERRRRAAEARLRDATAVPLLDVDVLELLAAIEAAERAEVDAPLLAHAHALRREAADAQESGARRREEANAQLGALLHLLPLDVPVMASYYALLMPS